MMKQGMVRAVFVGAMVIAMVVGLRAGAGAALSTTGVPIMDLGPGVAHDINNRNQVVGTLVTGGGDRHAFLWQNNQMQDLDSRVGGTSFAQAINYSGQVVGGRASGAEMQAYLWKPDGATQNLGKLRTTDTWSFAWDINSSGQVVGYSGSGTWSIANNGFSPISTTFSAFLWDPVTQAMRELTNMAPNSIAYGINDAGDVVGTMFLGAGSRGFLWENNGNITDLGSLNNTWSNGYDINNHRQIAGTSGYGGGSAGFLWENGTKYIMPQGGNANAQGINDEGAVVGLYASSSPDSHAYVGGVSDGQGYVSDLGTFQDGTHNIGYGTYADAINDLYTVVGSAERNGVQHATLWNPVPEPSSLFALGSGLFGFIGFLSRRRMK
ncbi:MAG: PEP-CTERM sorting domain-containing protein [Armatimonadota bacterium]|nr:PEP-CTERM sorting domain-containing protein [Armatimonadota bacterium]